MLQGNGEFIARVPCGFDDETGCVYSIFVALSPLAGHADIPGYELIFNIVEAQPDGTHIREYWDGEETKAIIIDREHRRLVRYVLAMLVKPLIDESNANLISMTTHTAGLPRKALHKFNQICSILREGGFQAGPADPYHGHHVWMMVK